jgi:hypothetical protein
MHTDRNIRLALGCALAVWLLALPGALAAEDAAAAAPPVAPGPAAPRPLNKGELARLESFLDQHPNIEARLRDNPSLTSNPAFQRNHPLFAQFLARHPEISAELAARPRWFVHRELMHQSAAPVTREQLADFDRFLDQHPGVERQLVQHPRLLRQPEFLGKAPELHEYLKRHPGYGGGEAKPERGMKAEHRN